MLTTTGCVCSHVVRISSNGVLIIEVPLYRTAYCGPSGVLIMEVSLYRTAHCGPSGVLIMEVSLYRTAHCGPNGVLITEVSLYRTVYSSPSGVLTIEVLHSMWMGASLYVHMYTCTLYSICLLCADFIYC